MRRLFQITRRGKGKGSRSRAARAGRRERQETRRFASNVSLGIVAVGVLVGLVAVANRWTAREELRSVVVDGLVVLDTAEVLEQAELPDTVNVDRLDLDAIERKISRHPFVQKVVAYYNGNGELVCEVEERSPVAVVVVGERPMYLDQRGVMLPFRFGVASPDVPLLTGVTGEDGEGFDSLGALDGIAVAEMLRRRSETLYHQVSEIERNDRGEYRFVLTEGGIPVLIGQLAAIEPRLQKLEAFLDQIMSTESGRRPTLIDLRWDGQVVVRWNHPVQA